MNVLSSKKHSQPRVKQFQMLRFLYFLWNEVAEANESKTKPTVIAGHLLGVDVVSVDEGLVDAGEADEINGALLGIGTGRSLLSVLRRVIDVSWSGQKRWKMHHSSVISRLSTWHCRRRVGRRSATCRVAWLTDSRRHAERGGPSESVCRVVYIRPLASAIGRLFHNKLVATAIALIAIVKIASIGQLS